MSELDELLVATVARHFPAASVARNTVDVGFGGVKIGCRTGALTPFSGVETAQLVFTLEAPELCGPIELMLTGYAATQQRAVVEGACAWACSFGPVLRAALSDDVHDDVNAFEIMDSRHQWRAYVDCFDHVLHFAPSGCEDTSTARVRLGGEPWLSTLVLDHGLELEADRIHVLSVFVGELPDKRIVEVKVDGVVRSGFDDLVDDSDVAPAPQMVLLRELCVIVPD